MRWLFVDAIESGGRSENYDAKLGFGNRESRVLQVG